VPRRTGRVIAAAVSAVLIAVFAYGWWNYRDLNNGLQRLGISTGSGGIDGKDQNLLIVGNDDRTDMTNAEVKALKVGRDGGSLSTDTMMIVHIPADGSKATLISLPRDSYVAIPGYGMNKLNSAYADAYSATKGSLNAKRTAGANLLIKTITNLTGLTIDHFVQVDLIGFYRIAQAVGGIPVDLCHAVNDTQAYDRETGQGGGSGFKMSAGHHTLDALQALEFVRQRHNLPNGDLDRTKRQRYFLTAAFRKIESADTLINPGKLHALIKAVDKSIYVDNGLNITTLAEQLANLSANNIVGKAIPFQRFATVDVGSVEIVNPAKVKAFIDRLINPPTSSDYSKAKAVAPSSVTVSVQNGGTVNGAAAQSTATLVKAGFKATVDTQPASLAATTIEYASGMEAQAKTLAKYVPGAQVKQSDVSTLTLVLGADGDTARSTPGGASSSSTPAKQKALDAGCIN